MTELVVGTAQFGDPYGVTNAVGALSDERVRAILRSAIGAGIRTFDTAVAYGAAESRIGRLLPPDSGAGFITKISLSDVAADGAEASVRASLRRLGTDRIDVLFHRAADLEDGRFPVVLDELSALRESGIVSGIGVSVYEHDELARGVDRIPVLDLIQIPGSVVDRRLLDDPLVAGLAAAGTEVHIRSVFLQGLLLAPPDGLPAGFDALAPSLRTLDGLAARLGCSRLAVLLGAVRQYSAVRGVVVGVTGEAELAEILEAWDAAPEAVDFVSELPVRMLDPRRW